MNLRQLQQFVALADTGNFHRAAERLHMAQPPLSVSIRKLEQELGGALFDRALGGVRLTAAGEAMLAHARQALFQAEQCREAAAAVLHGEAGKVRVGFIGTATAELLPRLIPSFRQHHPGIDLELTEATTQSALDGLLARRLDVGLIRYPLLQHGSFRLLPLDDDEFVLAVPARSRLAERSRIALSEAADEPFVMYAQSRVPNLYAVAMMRCHQSGFAPRIAQEALQVQTILSLVESGLGVALVAGVARRYGTRGVDFLMLDDTPPSFRIGVALVTLREAQARSVACFVDHAQALARQRES